MALLEAVGKNERLRYLDLQAGASYRFSELLDGCRGLPGGPRRLAFLYADSSVAAIATLWSLLARRHAVALFSDRLHPQLKSRLEGVYRPQLIHDRTRTGVEGYAAKATPGFGCCYFEATQPAEAALADELSVLLSTSGTTGSPKLVKLSEANLYQNALSILDYLPVVPDDVVPLNLPLEYAYGLSLLTTNSIAGGTLVASLRNPLDRRFWADFREQRMTSLAGTPELYELLVKLGFLDWELATLRYLTQAGGKLSEQMVKTFADYASRRGIRFYVMYGQSEATARMSYLPPELAASHPRSVGRPIKNGRFALAEDTGELIYRGPNVFGGYATSLADLATYQQPESLPTGDIGEVDAEGLYSIVGRIKRITKVLGARLNLDELEQLLQGAFAGARFACAELPANRLLVVRHGDAVPAESIRQYLLAVPRIDPEAVELASLEEFPKTSNGKLDYATLARIAMMEERA